jgi:two-component system nitrate/nitrite response regulator NarL
MTKIKLAIVDDCEQFRKAFIRLIRLESDLEMMLEAENGLHLLVQLKNKTPDIILMDISMPIMNGIEATDKIKKLYPYLKIIAYSQYDIEANISQMYIHGVESFIGKEDDPEELFKAIRIVHSGGVYLTEKASKIIRHSLELTKKLEPNVSLTETEKAIIDLILDGLTSRQIGEVINKSHRTVEDIRERLYGKLNVKNKEQLIALVSKWQPKIFDLNT